MLSPRLRNMPLDVRHGRAVAPRLQAVPQLSPRAAAWRLVRRFAEAAAILALSWLFAVTVLNVAAAVARAAA